MAQRTFPASFWGQAPAPQLQHWPSSSQEVDYGHAHGHGHGHAPGPSSSWNELWPWPHNYNYNYSSLLLQPSAMRGRLPPPAFDKPYDRYEHYGHIEPQYSALNASWAPMSGSRMLPLCMPRPSHAHASLAGFEHGQQDASKDLYWF